MTENIRVAMADDHPMMIDGLQNILPHYPHIKLVGTYLTGAELMKGLQHEVPDVLILDIQLPDKTGDELAPLILKKYPNIKILTLTNFDSTLYAHNMFKRGVHGYLLKNANKKVLIQAIETVYRGEEFIEDSMRQKIKQLDLKVKNTVFSKATLTQREKEILQLIANGNSAPEIAEQLFLSQKTVINYRSNIMLKLDVNNVALLVKKAITLGLVN